MKVRTNVGAGGWMSNHNQTLARVTKATGLRVKSRVRAGGWMNHNQTLARAAKPKGVKVKTRVRAGGWTNNHNQTLLA
jgi:hypothetical protein